MSDEEDRYDRELPKHTESPGDYATRGKLRRITLLMDQLQEVKEELQERTEIHERVMRDLRSEVSYSEGMLDRIKRFGSQEDKERRLGELRRKIDGFKKERWREQVKAWRDTQDLMREARKLNRALSDLKLRLEDLKDYLAGSGR